MTHTPGPWTVEDHNVYEVLANDGHQPIARVWRGPDGLADARLIAAAPALLEALERISNGPATVSAADSRESMYATLRDIVAQTRAAIALARGQDVPTL